MSDEKPPSEKAPEEPEADLLATPMNPALLENVPKTQVGVELEGVPKNLAELLGQWMAFWEKEMYAIIERTNFQNPHEIHVFTGLIHTATHGIGGDLLDIPEPEIGERVVKELQARRSLKADSSERSERIMTGWLAVLRKQEEEKLKQQQSAAVGVR